ncbi:MAG: Uncharacterised protein [Glaciecola sp. HTCC2999]|jgi:putative membrane protein|nr:MAG: Uncharacterised protein [Glaciecola sp. HTCC2999]
MDTFLNSIAGLGDFVLYFAVALLLLLVFKVIYSKVTPHDEWMLIKEQQSTAAAIAFGGALIGFAIALSGAAANAVALTDFIIWAIVALVAQCLAFLLLRFTFMPKIAERIEQNEVSAGIMLAAVSIAVGLLNAACMTY